MITLICENCGSSFERKQRGRRGQRIFCSFNCYATAPTEAKIVKPCENCGKKVTRYKNDQRGYAHTFCSLKCYDPFRRRGKPQWVCTGCGKTFERSGKPEGRPYCSTDCVYKHAATEDTLLKRFWKRVQKTDSCWIWTGTKLWNGYGSLSLGRARGFSIDQKHYAHRVSWLIHNGEIPDGIFVCHRCDNPICVRPDHLFLGTPLDNMRDMISKGRASWQR